MDSMVVVYSGVYNVVWEFQQQKPKIFFWWIAPDCTWLHFAFWRTSHGSPSLHGLQSESNWLLKTVIGACKKTYEGSIRRSQKVSEKIRDCSWFFSGHLLLGHCEKRAGESISGAWAEHLILLSWNLKSKRPRRFADGLSLKFVRSKSVWSLEGLCLCCQNLMKSWWCADANTGSPGKAVGHWRCRHWRSRWTRANVPLPELRLTYSTGRIIGKSDPIVTMMATTGERHSMMSEIWSCQQTCMRK